MAKFLRSAKTALLYCGLSKENYEKISPLIDERNFSFANIISIAMMIFGIIFLISQILSPTASLFPYYFLILSGLLLFVLGKTLMNRTDRGKMLYRYLQICVVFAFAMILSAQGSNREQPSVSIVVFLALLPLTINDRPLRMAAVVFGAATIYLIWSSHVKIPAMFRADIFNTLTFTTLGMAVYLLISNRNIHEIYLRQQAVESDRLREKMRAAEMANAAKSEFLANMSHEIRTPINAMLGMNEIILRDSLQARQAPTLEREDARALFGDICRYAGDIDSAGNSLLGIINDILDFSKIEAGKIEIFSAPYKLSSVLNDVSNMILFKARSKDLNFQVEVDETIPDILNGDEVRVRQIITNLLNNAVKYTEQGNVILSVRTGPGTLQEGKALNLIISVRDTGIGIREEDIGRLFAKFERVDLEHNSSIEGTGLGLAITKNLLDLMGGKIDVKSIYGVGSVFTVTLPQTVVSLEPVGNFREKFEQSIQTAKAAKDNFRAPDAHILIVDDIKQDLVISAYKPKESFLHSFINSAGNAETAWSFVSQHLSNLPVVVIKADKIEIVAERQAFLLFDRMVAYHIMQGIPVPMDATDFYKGLDERYLKRDEMYFLPDQVNEYDTARIKTDVEPIQFSLFVTNEKTAISWLYQQLSAPQTYSEIQPKFMQEVKSVDRYEDMPELAVLLEENFLQDDKGRWYIPDVTKEGDVAKLREKKLWREFEGYMSSKGKLKLFRSEAIRVGFSRLWKDKNYQAIVDIANRLPEQTIQEDPNLLMYYDISLSRV